MAIINHNTTAKCHLVIVLHHTISMMNGGKMTESDGRNHRCQLDPLTWFMLVGSMADSRHIYCVLKSGTWDNRLLLAVLVLVINFYYNLSSSVIPLQWHSFGFGAVDFLLMGQIRSLVTLITITAYHQRSSCCWILGRQEQNDLWAPNSVLTSGWLGQVVSLCIWSNLVIFASQALLSSPHVHQ